MDLHSRELGFRRLLLGCWVAGCTCWVRGHDGALYFALAEISNPKLGVYAVRYTRGLSSSRVGSVHTLMIVRADLQQSRKLWKNYNMNHTGNCLLNVK
jgi:hypothetical protein